MRNPVQMIVNRAATAGSISARVPITVTTEMASTACLVASVVMVC